jgi:hypothetical protein
MNKKVFIGIGVVLGVALLAGAAFMAARMFGAAQPGGAGGPLLPILGAGGPGGKGSFSMSIQITPAPEIPQTQADVTGQVTEIKDNSIFVSSLSAKGSGGNAVIIGKVVTSGGSDSGPSTDSSDGTSIVGGQSPTPSGPLTEVVISKDTLIYRDTSMDSVPKPSAGGSTNMSIQQTVELIDISQISTDFMVQVWGQKRGDRVIAEKIVVMGAIVVQFNAGAGDAPPK